MKKVFNLTVMLAALMTAVMFSSCSKDDPDDPTILGPDLQVTPSETADNYVFKVEARAGDNDLKSLVIQCYGYAVDIKGCEWNGKKDKEKDGIRGKLKGTSFQETISFPKAVYGDSEQSKFVFTLTDKIGKTTVYPPTAKAEAESVYKEFVNVTVGYKYEVKQEGLPLLTIEITAAKVGEVSFKVNDGATVTLGDAASLHSYFATDLTTMGVADAFTTPEKVFFLLKGGTTTLVAGNQAKDATISAGAKETKFKQVYPVIDYTEDPD